MINSKLKHITTSLLTNIMLAVLLIYAIQGCTNKSNNNNKVIEVDIDSSQLFLKYKNSSFCIPSPLQISLFLNKLDVLHDESLVNNPVNISNYSSSTKKTMNIGVYGADIGYLKLFPNTLNINQYFLAIKQLASDLNIENAYNSALTSKIEANLNNRDSLYQYIGLMYQHADEFLKENSRQQVSTLIITGGWIEGFYLLTQLYKHTRNNDLYSFISQQKYALDNLIKLLAPYYNSSEELTTITDQLVDLAYQFDVIDLKYSTQLPIQTNNNGVYEINSRTNIENNMKEIESIIEKTMTIRSLIVL